MNNVQLMGRLTYDPELRTTSNGTSVLRFQVACNRPAVKGKEQESDFIDCIAWRKTAEFIAKYFKKGSMILVSDGTITTSNFTDKDGNKRKSVEVTANGVEFCGGKSGTSTASAPKSDNAQPAAKTASEPEPAPAEEFDDDFDELLDDPDMMF